MIESREFGIIPEPGLNPEFNEGEFASAIARAEDLENPNKGFFDSLRRYGATVRPEIL